jgi:hypothetical protein
MPLVEAENIQYFNDITLKIKHIIQLILKGFCFSNYKLNKKMLKRKCGANIGQTMNSQTMGKT